MKSILVTGGAGFLGSFLCEEMIRSGYKVAAVDNLFRGREENLAGIRANPQFSFYKLDLSDPESVPLLNKILNDENIDTVCHLAAVNGTQYFYDRSTFVLDQNTRITQNVLYALENTPVKNFAYSSSSETYGEPLQIPTPETHPVLLNSGADRDSYSSSKAIGDFYTRLFCIRYGIRWQVWRIFNLYGERMVNTRYGQVIPEFVRRMYYEKSFTILGDGAHTRSFCYIRDAVTLMRLVLEKEFEGFINMGYDDEISMLALAKRIHELAGKEFKPEFLPARPNDHRRRCPDLTLLRKTVGDYKFTNLDDGLLKTMEYYKNLGPGSENEK